jgi:hypothetical protein
VRLSLQVTAGISKTKSIANIQKPESGPAFCDRGSEHFEASLDRRVHHAPLAWTEIINFLLG